MVDSKKNRGKADRSRVSEVSGPKFRMSPRT
jgi:hypothetical protein